MTADLELQERLGRGDLAEVWKAFDPQAQHYVAVKRFDADLLNDPAFMTFYQNLPRLPEAQRILALQHPNIVRLHGFHITPSSEAEKPVAYLVMDYIEGPTLADAPGHTSARHAFPSLTDLLHFFEPIAAAIDYAHEQGVIHGDLKPSNILLDTHHTARHPLGEPMLTDFGLTNLLRTSSSLLRRGERALPFALSPEQAQGHPATERSDLYALGAILYELCTGTPPFQGERAALNTDEQSSTPPPPSQLNPGISPAFSAVIMRSLATDQQERFPTAAALLSALSEAIALSAPEMLSSPLSPAYTSNDQDPLLSAAVPGQPDLVSSTLSSSPRGAAQSAPRPSWSENTGPAVPPTLADPSGQDERDEPSPAASTAFSSPPPSTPWPTSWDTPSSPASLPPPTTPVAPSAVDRDRRPRSRFSKGLVLALIVLLILLLAATTLTALLVLPRTPARTGTTPGTTPAATVPVVGHVYFLSSGQLYVNNNQGIYDQVLLDLHNIAAPSPGTSYFAWLLGDSNQSDTPWLSLGQVSVSPGKVHFLYPGNPTHTNLLVTFSRVLLTQEQTSAPTLDPLLDPHTWRYYGEIYQLPSPEDVNHFSLLDHLRHLLVQAPELTVLGLPGGLSIWLLRNVEEILRWSVEARDRFLNTAAVRGLLTNILYYLDGECTPADLQGAPAGTPLTPGNATIALIARFALINPCLQEQQEQPNLLKQAFRTTPHDYIDHTLFHLTGVIVSPGANAQATALATQLNKAVADLKTALERVRQDAVQLVNMSDAQLQQPAALALAGDMALQARYAYAGQTDPVTGSSQEGVIWIYNNIQRLATFDVTPYATK